MKKILISIILVFAFASNAISATFTSRDIKQPSETKLFISGNHQTPDFEDLSASKNQFTKVGDVKTVNEKSTVNPKYFPVGNDKGIYFDGTGDYLSTSSLGIDDFTFPSGTDFTIDFWLYVNGTVTDKSMISKYTTWSSNVDFCLEYLTARPRFFAANGNIILDSGTGYNNFALNSWGHIAIVRTEATCKMFLNGIPVVEDTSSNYDVTNNCTTLLIGKNSGSASYNFPGFMQNIRISKGIARWTSNFTPPALNSTYPTDSYTKLYIKGHDKAVNTTAMVDDSGTSKTITTVGDTKIGYSRGTAAYFDDTGDYVTVPSNSDFDFSISSFTVEFWLQMPSVANLKWFWAASNFSLFYNNGFIVLGVNGGANATTHTLTNNKWAHIAIVKTSSGNTIVYKDGVASANITANQNSGNALMSLGAYSDGNYTANCYVQGLRVDKNIARYTSNFTPPETEPTPDAYTKLLMRNSVLNIRDISASPKTITVYGQTAQQTVALRKNLYFDGVGDYITIPVSTDFDLGVGDFTVDFWLNYSSVIDGINSGIIGNCSTTTGFEIYYKLYESYGLGGLFYYTSGTNSHIYSHSLNLNSGIWYHIALVKYNGYLYLYKNGVSCYSPVASSNNTATVSTNPLTIGKDSRPSQSYYLKGYISDIRVTKGRALWTSNFTPPRRSGAF